VIAAAVIGARQKKDAICEKKHAIVLTLCPPVIKLKLNLQGTLSLMITGGSI
jgi:hypothetical protein